MSGELVMVDRIKDDMGDRWLITMKPEARSRASYVPGPGLEVLFHTFSKGQNGEESHAISTAWL